MSMKERTVHVVFSGKIEYDNSVCNMGWTRIAAAQACDEKDGSHEFLPYIIYWAGMMSPGLETGG